MDTTNQYCNRQFSFETFTHFLSPTVLEKARQRMNPGCRNRCLGLQGFIWMGLFLAAHTALPNMQLIFDLAGQLPLSLHSTPLVTVSAFCQYRNTFSLKVMLYFWRYLLSCFEDKINLYDHAWKGFKLRALDGTTLNLPEKLYPHFGASNGAGPGPVQGFLMVLYDLTWQAPLALRLRPDEDKGRSHLVLKRLMSHLKPTELLVIDAGLYSIEIFSLLLSRRIHFIIPMTSKAKPKRIKRFNARDGLYQLTASGHWRGNALVYKYLTVRIIAYQKRGFQTRYLVTSLLDQHKYPANEIVQIYHRRWDIETFFRDFKHTLQATHWHARTLPAIYSELLFQMLLVTLTRLVMADAAAKAHIMPRQISFGRSLAKVKQALTILVFIPVWEWPNKYQELVKQMANYRIDIRRGRTYERDTAKRRRQSRSLFVLFLACFVLMRNKYA